MRPPAPPARPGPRRAALPFTLAALCAVSGLGALGGCAVVEVAGATAGAAISVAGAVVATGVKVTGKVVEKTVDLVTPSAN